MTNFKLIFQILSLLDKYLDYDNPDWDKLSAENFKVSQRRFVSIMIMLCGAGYIEGIEAIHLGGNEYDLKYIAPAITLKGLEYLEGNGLMHKTYRLLKGGECTPAYASLRGGSFLFLRKQHHFS